MERAILDVEHNTEIKNIQTDEFKLKQLQQEHQLRLEAFNLHTNQVKYTFFFIFYFYYSKSIQFS